MGEVTKYLVYNMRKRQEGGDTAEHYFNCTEQVGLSCVYCSLRSPHTAHGTCDGLK